MRMQTVDLRKLFVEEIFLANLVEGGKVGCPTRDDFFRRNTFLQETNGFRVSGKEKEFGEIEVLGIKLLQDYRDLELCANGTHRGTSRNPNHNATAALPGVKARNRDEWLARKSQPRKVARIQRSSDYITVHPRSAKFLERRFRAASHGDPGVLQNLDARVKDGALLREQIRRGWNPPDSGALEEIVTVPVFHGDDMKIHANVIFRVEELRELANRKAVTHRKRKIANEASLVSVKQRTFHDFAADGVGAVEHEESDVALAASSMQ